MTFTIKWWSSLKNIEDAIKGKVTLPNDALLDIASDTACSMAFWIGLSFIKP